MGIKFVNRAGWLAFVNRDDERKVEFFEIGRCCFWFHEGVNQNPAKPFSSPIKY